MSLSIFMISRFLADQKLFLKNYPRRGLTLIETILAITIMGLTAAILLPHFVKEGFIGSLALRSAASQVASDIRYTRQFAITQRGHYLINFNFEQKSYNIYNNTIAPGNQVGETKEMASQVTPSGTNQFDFYSLGNAVFNGTGLLLTQGTHQYRISVELPTGAAVVEKIS